MARKKIDEKIKQKVVEARAVGRPVSKIAEEFGVSVSSVRRIVKDRSPKTGEEETIQKRIKTARQKRIENLERRIFELEKKILEMEARRRSSRKCNL